MSTTGSVSTEEERTLPAEYVLHQSYPNPFNPTAIIPFEVRTRAYVKLKVYDVVGREVRTLVSKVLAPGQHNAVFNAEDLPSGVYFYGIQMGTFSDVKKMVLVK